MKVFSYSDYIKSIHTLRLNSVFQLAEESTSYELEQNTIENINKQLVKKILKDKGEMAKFINTFLNLKEKVVKEDLDEYKLSSISKKYKFKEPDILYKLKNEERYFLIEQQSIIDNMVIYRMLNYCIDIMYNWSKNKKKHQDDFYPTIIPIIIYTGSKKWNVLQREREKRISDYVVENYEIDLKYNLIDISRISNKILLNMDSLFGYGMIMAKSKNEKEIKENIKIILENNKENDVDSIKNMIVNSFLNLYGHEKINIIKDKKDRIIK